MKGEILKEELLSLLEKLEQIQDAIAASELQNEQWVLDAHDVLNKMSCRF